MTKSVLMIDDEEDFVEVMIQLLQNKGYENAQYATNGKSGINLYKQFSHDFVFIDSKMPYLDGFQVAKELHIINPQVNIYIISGSPTIETTVKIKNIPIKGTLLKPIKVEQIIDILNQ